MLLDRDNVASVKVKAFTFGPKLMTAPLGKRAARKADTVVALMQAARDLFRDRGYEATRMEDIAAVAGIAVGTLYNYFESKADLLLAIVVDADRACIAAAEELFESLPDDPAEALAVIALHDSRHSLDALDKTGWRQVLAATLTGPDSAFARAYAATTFELESLFVRVVQRLQTKGQLRSDLSAKACAGVIFAAKYTRFIEHVSDETAVFADHERDVRTVIRLCIQGLAPNVPVPVHQDATQGETSA